MDEEKIIEMLQKSGEDLEIPESLSPESIERKIREKQKKEKTNRHFYGKMLAGLASAACVAMGVYGIWQNQNIGNPPEQLEIAAAKDEKMRIQPELARASEGEEPALNSDSYKKAYEALEEAIINREVSQLEAVKAESSPTEQAADYSTTNLRTREVEEADIIKNDGSYLYVLLRNKNGDGNRIHILKAEGEKLTHLSEIAVTAAIAEFYLQGNRLIALERIWAEPANIVPVENKGIYNGVCQEAPSYGETKIHIYDISDRKAPKPVKSLSQSGEYESSRIRDGVLYTFSRFYPQLKEREDWESYIPKVQKKLLQEECIFMPEKVEDGSYLVITALFLEHPESFSDEKAILSAGRNYYVSEKNIYVLKEKYTEDNRQETKIQRYAYDGGKITSQGSQAVPGSVDDSFSIDEYKGWLRVLTTDRSSLDGESINALYVLDEDLKIKGELTGLAKGESIYSARFLEDTAYFVTFRQMDPLFTVDLSNPQKPQILGELKITGFSEYLHFYGKNRLLGIGREADPKTGEDKGLKLSVFDISKGSDVKEIHKTVLGEQLYTTAFEDYRNVLISPEKNIIGFAATEDYFVYSYEEDRGFVEKLHIKNAALTGNMEYQTVRGAFIKDTFYLIKGSSGIEAYDLNKNTKTGEWKL